MFDKEKIDWIIEYCGVEIPISEPERRALIKLRRLEHRKMGTGYQWNAARAPTDRLFMGQPLVPVLPMTLAYFRPRVPQSLVTKAHAGEQKLLVQTCADWPHWIERIASEPTEFLNSLPSEDFEPEYASVYREAESRIPSPLYLTFRLAALALEGLAGEVRSAVREASGWSSVARERADYTLDLTFNTNFVDQSAKSIVKRLPDVNGDPIHAGKNSLVSACTQAKTDFLMTVPQSPVHMHCPAHIVVNRLLKDDTSPLPALYRAVSASLVVPANIAPSPARPDRTSHLSSGWIDLLLSFIRKVDDVL